ncbi:MAG: putative transcriptional regulator [Candidatus Azotimanducaceae bacterium]|jgi:putative transcriptional regulator
MSEVRLHPDANLLVEYSSGSLSPALAVSVSTHLHYCKRCQAHVSTLNEIGGKFLNDVAPEQVSGGCLSSVMSQLEALDRDDGEDIKVALATDLPASLLPPLVSKLLPVGGAKWRRLSPSLKVARLPVGEQQFELALHHIKAGGKAPIHDHSGQEITVVLQGSFSDDEGVYHEGDFIIREPGNVHMPVATANCSCVCLSVLEAPIQMVGTFKRLLNPFLSFEPS